MGFDHVAGRAEQEADRMLGCRNDIGFRRIDDDYTAFGSAFHLDVVNAVTGTANYF